MPTSESTNLTQDGKSAWSDTYFASPELSQRADLLRHLTENSNLIPLIRGVEGMGKTTFIQHLLDLAPENWIPVGINADVMLQPDTLLANLAGMFDQDDRSERLIDDLVRHFHDLRQDGFLPVIIVDDAHLLPEASIITLLRLHERGADDVPLAQILLFAEPEIDDLLKTPQLRVMNLKSLQLLDMPEFTLEQTGLYLEHILSSEELSSIKPLTDYQIEKIHDETGGSPGLIKQYAQGLIDSSDEPSSTFNLSDYFSGKNIVVGLIAIFVVLVLIYQDDINAIFSGDKETNVAAQRPQIEAGDSMPLALPDSKEVAVLEQEIAEFNLENQAVPGDMEKVEGEEADLGPVTDEGNEKKAGLIAEPKKQAAQPEMDKVQPEPEVTAPPPPEETKPPRRAEATVAETQALSGAKEVPAPASVEKEVAKKAAPAESVPPKRIENKDQIKKQEPKLSKAALPVKPVKKQEIAQKEPEVIKQEPKIQSQAVKKPKETVEVKQKLATPPARPKAKTAAPEVKQPVKPVEVRPPSPIQKKAHPAPAPVEDRSTVLVTEDVSAVKLIDKPAKQIVEQPAGTGNKPAVTTMKKRSGRFLREAWLLKQKPSSYTIQLVGLQDEKGITGFIKRHSVDGPIAYYRTLRNGKPWFPVLYGAYSTKARAVTARGKLPKSLIDSGAWLRTLGSVQKDIRAR